MRRKDGRPAEIVFWISFGLGAVFMFGLAGKFPFAKSMTPILIVSYAATFVFAANWKVAVKKSVIATTSIPIAAFIILSARVLVNLFTSTNSEPVLVKMKDLIMIGAYTWIIMLILTIPAAFLLGGLTRFAWKLLRKN